VPPTAPKQKVRTASYLYPILFHAITSWAYQFSLPCLLAYVTHFAQCPPILCRPARRVSNSSEASSARLIACVRFKLFHFTFLGTYLPRYLPYHDTYPLLSRPAPLKYLVHYLQCDHQPSKSRGSRSPEKRSRRSCSRTRASRCVQVPLRSRRLPANHKLRLVRMHRPRLVTGSIYRNRIPLLPIHLLWILRAQPEFL